MYIHVWNWHIREVTGGRKSCFEYIFLKNLWRTTGLDLEEKWVKILQSLSLQSKSWKSRCLMLLLRIPCTSRKNRRVLFCKIRCSFKFCRICNEVNAMEIFYSKMSGLGLDLWFWKNTPCDALIVLLSLNDVIISNH